jgi:hypothetical protein
VCDGTKHCSKQPHRHANSDMAVFFLQSKLGKAKWPVTKAAIDELKLAFLSTTKASLTTTSSSSSADAAAAVVDHGFHSSDKRMKSSTSNISSMSSGISIQEEALRRKAKFGHKSFHSNSSGGSGGVKKTNAQQTNNHNKKKKVDTRCRKKHNK